MMSEKNTYLLSGNATVLKLAKEFFAGHPTLVFSMLYFYFSVVGTIYTYILLDNFNVNIFDFFRVTDFLYIALKSPLIFSFSIIGIFYFIDGVLTKVDTSQKSKFDEIFWKVLRKFYKMVCIFLFFAPLFIAFLAAENQARYIKGEKIIRLEGNKTDPDWVNKLLIEYLLAQKLYNLPNIKLELQDNDNSKRSDWLNDKLLLIASTNQNIFIYNQDNKSTYVIPNTNVIYIKFPYKQIEADSTKNGK